MGVFRVFTIVQMVPNCAKQLKCIDCYNFCMGRQIRANSQKLRKKTVRAGIYKSLLPLYTQGMFQISDIILVSCFTQFYLR